MAREDSINTLINTIADSLPEVSPWTLGRIRSVIKRDFKEVIFVERVNSKAVMLEKMQALPKGLTNKQVATHLGITIRRVQQLRRICSDQ